MNVLYKNQEVSQLEQETNLKLVKIYIEQAEQLRSLSEFEEAEKKGDLAHELRIKAMLSLYPHLNREKIELIGAIVWSLGCYGFYPILKSALTIAHNQKVSGLAFTLTSWVEYSEKYRKQWAWILKELYQQQIKDF